MAVPRMPRLTSSKAGGRAVSWNVEHLHLGHCGTPRDASLILRGGQVRFRRISPSCTCTEERTRIPFQPIGSPLFRQECCSCPSPSISLPSWSGVESQRGSILSKDDAVWSADSPSDQSQPVCRSTSRPFDHS